VPELDPDYLFAIQQVEGNGKAGAKTKKVAAAE